MESALRFLRAPPDGRLPDELVGWCVGVAMFSDEEFILAKTLMRQPSRLDRYVIDAFVAGVSSGLPTQKRQWEGIEDLVERLGEVPDALVEILPFGLRSRRGADRATSLRLAQRCGPVAIDAIQAARDHEEMAQARARFDGALETLQLTSGSGAAGPAEQLLEELLAAWAASRHEALADAIVRVGKSLHRPTLSADSQGELEVVWLALAARRDVADVARLFAAPWPAAWEPALERIKALETFPVDPRIARGLAARATKYQTTGWRHLGPRLVALLTRIADPGSVPILARVGYKDTISAIESAAPETPAAPPKELLDRVAAWLGDSTDIDALWSAVWNEPARLSARLVLADALSDRGDPRGEFISLQCMEAPTRKTKARANKLLKSNIDQWTGTLPTVERASRVFERGFLSRVRVTAHSAEVNETVDQREWRTIEELTLGDRYGALDPAVLSNMPCLRVLYAEFGALDEHLPKRGSFPSIRTLGAVNQVMKRRGAFPGLRVLAGNWYRWNMSEEHCRAILGQFAALDVTGLIVRKMSDGDFHGDAWARLYATYLDMKPEGTLCLDLTRDLHTRRIRERGWRVHLTPEQVTVGWYGGGKWSAFAPPRFLEMFKETPNKRVCVPVRGKSGESQLKALKAALTRDVELVEEPLTLLIDSFR